MGILGITGRDITLGMSPNYCGILDQKNEKPYFDDEAEDYDPYVDVWLKKELLFNLEESGVDTAAIGDESAEFIALCGKHYKIVVRAVGWIDEERVVNERDIDNFRVYFDLKGYGEFAKDFNGIKSSVTREIVYNAFKSFVNDNFSDLDEYQYDFD